MMITKKQIKIPTAGKTASIDLQLEGCGIVLVP